MTHENGFYKNGRYYNAWFSDNATATIVVSHGLGEHSGRYKLFAEYFTKHDFHVLALDHLGHGKTEGVRGHIDGFEQYDADLADFIKFAKEKTRSEKVILVGHSLGSVIAHHYLLKSDINVAKLVLSSPGYEKLVPPAAIKVVLGKLIAKILPKLTMGNEIDVADICRDRAIVEAYSNDSLVHGLVSTRFFTSFLEAMEKIENSNTLAVPVLYQVAAGDRIVDPKKARSIFDALNMENKAFIEYKDFYHEIYNEKDRLRVYEDLLKWLRV